MSINKIATDITNALVYYVDGQDAADDAKVAGDPEACVKLTGRDNSGRWAFDGYHYCGTRFAGVVATLPAGPTAHEITDAAERISEWVENQ